MLLRNLRSILGIALLSLAAAMLTVPATALADGPRGHDGFRRHDDGRHRDHDDHRYRGKHDHHRYVAKKNHRHYGFAPGRPPPHAAAYHKRAPYYCARCNHRFAVRTEFHGHLSHHHQIAPWRLPFVVIHHSLGWVFFG